MSLLGVNMKSFLYFAILFFVISGSITNILRANWFDNFFIVNVFEIINLFIYAAGGYFILSLVVLLL